jgi:Mlc titration factor MtfA (ptsG expression regulator)
VISLLSKRGRRERIKRRPFPPEWCAILCRRVPYYSRLSLDDQRELQGHIQIFLAEKRFEGCPPGPERLEITDEIRVTIAAQACVLLLHRETDYYSGLKTILVYPAKFVSTIKSVGPGGIITEGVGVRLGESWNGTMSVRGGPVVLSWDDAKAGAADVADGHNVVFHEFAHQLDAESGAVDGAPALDKASQYLAWARVLGGEYARLIEDIAYRRPHLLDNYAATNPAEFFAVATEFFFERPRELRAMHPELYAQLAGFFRQDPARTLLSRPAPESARADHGG